MSGNCDNATKTTVVGFGGRDDTLVSTGHENPATGRLGASVGIVARGDPPRRATASIPAGVTLEYSRGVSPAQFEGKSIWKRQKPPEGG